MIKTDTLRTPKKAALERPWKDNRERAIWIGAELKRRGLSFSELARREGVSTAAFTNTAAGAANANLEPVIAEAIERDQVWLFPEHYRAGERIAKVRGSNRTPLVDQGKVKRREAA